MLLKEEQLKAVSNREYKSSAFTAYFGTPENAAQLYRALCQYQEEANRPREVDEAGEADELKEEALADAGPEDIVFETLQGILYLARKDDMAFTVGGKILVIGEHQSTVNRNMPLRSAIYYGRTMERIVPPKDMYKSKIIPIPTPEFYVFYNGKAPQPLEQTLKLSDSYLEQTHPPMLELNVKVININLPEKHPILQKCRPLYEYSWFIQRIREYLETKVSRDEAISKAIKDSMQNGIMVEFMKKHGSEVHNMLFGEFNLEDAKEVWKEEAREDGLAEGLAEGRTQGLEEGRTQGLAEGRTQGLAEGRTQGLEEGRTQGEDLLAELMSRLFADKREEDAKLAANDKDARKRFYMEYHMLEK